MKDTTHVKTTVYISRHLHDQAKIMAVLTRSSMSKLMCEALRDKINELKLKNKEKK